MASRKNLPVQNTRGLDKQLKALGRNVKGYKKPSIDILETFDAPKMRYPGTFFVTFTQFGEFTSNCPLTGQPDFADIKIMYRPKKKCVESKALKLYLQSFRNTGAFGEAITNRIADDLFQVLDPEFLVVIGDFKPRGGIGWAPEAIRVSGDRPYMTDCPQLTATEMIKLEKFR